MAQTQAYVLIRASSGKPLSAVQAIRGIPGVQSADPVTGVYDIICRIAAESLDELASTVVDRIQGVEGVERTETALIVRGQ
jgi:DNA-binding Lrp family transcriptional regulator